MEKRESVQVHYHVQIESKMSWTIACLTFDIIECFSTLLQFWHLPETEFGNLPFQWSRIRHSSSHSFYFEEAMILECIYMANYFDSNQMMKFHYKLAHCTWLCCLLHPMVFLAEFLGSSVTRTPQFAAVRHILYGWTVRLDGEYLKIDAGNSVRHVSEIVELFIPNFASDRCQKNAWRFIELSSLIGFSIGC